MFVILKSMGDFFNHNLLIKIDVTQPLYFHQNHHTSPQPQHTQRFHTEGTQTAVIVSKHGFCLFSHLGDISFPVYGMIQPQQTPPTDIGSILGFYHICHACFLVFPHQFDAVVCLLVDVCLILIIGYQRAVTQYHIRFHVCRFPQAQTITIIQQHKHLSGVQKRLLDGFLDDIQTGLVVFQQGRNGVSRVLDSTDRKLEVCSDLL